MLRHSPCHCFDFKYTVAFIFIYTPVQLFVVSSFWNLLNFIIDRNSSERNRILYELQVNKTAPTVGDVSIPRKEDELLNSLRHWANENISREEVEIELRRSKVIGAFMIRCSSENMWETIELSVKCASDIIVHYAIVLNEEEIRIECADRRLDGFAFPNFTKLVQHYARYHSNMRQRLTYSIKRRDDAWNIDRSELEISEQIGNGSFGKVRLATFNGRHVAVKSLFRESGITEAQFIEEAEIARPCNHPNVLHTIGICRTVDRVFIITEFMQNKSLKSFFEKNEMTATGCLIVSRKVATAMEYLESLRFRDVENCEGRRFLPL
ncbi:hypothetical protein PRIPAC_85796 [Pristionchus pacificus]|nr:hypothetical protein PRIPAC_85796 [Pristionchus pacificus]